MDFEHTLTDISAVWELENHWPVTAVAVKESKAMRTACTLGNTSVQIQSLR